VPASKKVSKPLSCLHRSKKQRDRRTAKPQFVVGQEEKLDRKTRNDDRNECNMRESRPRLADHQTLRSVKNLAPWSEAQPIQSPRRSVVREGRERCRCAVRDTEKCKNSDRGYSSCVCSVCRENDQGDRWCGDKAV